MFYGFLVWVFLSVLVGWRGGGSRGFMGDWWLFWCVGGWYGWFCVVLVVLFGFELGVGLMGLVFLLCVCVFGWFLVFRVVVEPIGA